MRVNPWVVLALLATACSRDVSPSVDAAATPVASPSPSPANAALIARVDQIAAEALEKGPIAGLSIAVHAHGQEVLARGYGFADVEAQVPAGPDTSYPMASVSKRWTAAAILKLADQGKLSLDDPLSRFFPSARAAIGALTIRNLLQHTSGFTKAGPAPRGAAESVLARGGTARTQGDDWTYSNYNFSLLGLVIEKVAGVDYATYVQQEIAGPLGLKGTAYCEDGRPVPGRAKDYLSAPGVVNATAYWSEARFYAAGGLCSTVRDVVAFETALKDGRIVSPAMLALMNEPVRLASGVRVDYGFGTRLGWTGSHRKLGHTGGGQGNKAVVARYPDDDVIVVVLQNTERDDAPVTATEIEDEVEHAFFELSPPAEAPDAEAASRVAGEYRIGSSRFRLSASEGGILVSGMSRRSLASRYVHIEGSTFAEEKDPSVELRFFDEDGGGWRRYRHGWFTGFAVRAAAGAPAPTPDRTPAPRRPRRR